jgi:hypothetical protein
MFGVRVLLLLKSVSSVVKLVVGAAISVRKLSSLVPSHLFSLTLQSCETLLELTIQFYHSICFTWDEAANRASKQATNKGGRR